MTGKIPGLFLLSFGVIQAACFGAPVQMQDGEFTGMPLPQSIYGKAMAAPVAPLLPGRADALTPYLRNGDFETTESDGSLAEWNIFRQSFFDADPSLARSGNVSVRSSYLFGWAQDLLIPVSPYQSFGVAGYALREGEWERAGIRGVYFDEAGDFLEEDNVFSPVAAPVSEYGEFWTAHEVPENAARMSLFLRGQSPQSWLRFDDLSLVSEQFSFSNTATAEAWELTGGAMLAGTSIILTGGSSAAQRVVVGPENQSYFVWGRYTSDSDVDLTVSEQWLARDTGEVISSTSTLQLLQAPEGTFVSDPGRMAGSASGSARVSLEAGASGEITITSLRRGFAKVEPATLTAGPASPDGSLKLTAAWPEHLSTATVQIITEGGALSDATTISLLGTSVRAEWDPASAAAGDYTARFTLQSHDAEIVVVDRTFQVVREDFASPTITPLRPAEFTRGIWLFVTGNNSASHTNQMFELLREDGFDFALVLASTLSKLPDIKHAAELYDIPYVVFAPEAVSVFRDYEKRSWFSKADYISRMKEMFAPVVGSELFRGIFVVDEPARPEELQTLQKTFLSIAQDGTLGSPYTVFLESITAGDFARVQPPVAWVDVYPYNIIVGRGATEELLRRIPVVNEHAKSLAALGRDLWILPQAFISRLNNIGIYPVPPSMHSAQLGAAVLAGARGILPFFYAAHGTMEGMRLLDLSPTPMLEPYQRFNAIVERIGPLLMQLELPDLYPDTPYPFAVSTAIGPGGENYVFALNADEQTTRTLIVALESIPEAPLADLVSMRKLALGDAGEVVVDLEPGQWALFSIGTNSIEALSALEAPPPATLTTIELPVTHQFTITGLSGLNQAVRGLEFNSTGDTLAATVPFVYAPSEPMIYNLESSGTVSRENGPLSWVSEKNGVTEDGLFSVTSPYVGLKLFSSDGLSTEPIAQFKGRTGGGYDVLRDGATTWLSIDVGIRQLENTTSGLVSTAVGWANRGNYLDLFGPFADGSVTALVSDFGVSNIKPGRLHEFLHTYAILNSVDRNADMNSSLLLAAPRHQWGVALFQLSATGEPQIVGNIATETLDACAVAWVYDNLLAVVDGYKSIRFYWILNNEATLIETWRPPLTDHFYMLSIAVAEGRLAVGLQDGRVLVADTSELRQPSAAVSDWALYAE